MERFLLAVLMLTLSVTARADDHCPVEVRAQATTHGTGIAINGSSCKGSLEEFWRVVEGRLPRPLPRDLTWLSLMMPAGADQVAAMSRAWGRVCNSPGWLGASFLEAYKQEPAAKILAPSLAELTPAPDSVDNFYVVKRSKGSISNSVCDSDLMTPVIYYSLSHAR